MTAGPAIALVDHVDRKPIWLLTCLFLCETIKRSRTWGWFPTKNLAMDAARENHGDLFECGEYNTIVIEEIPWGALGMTNSETWLSVTPIEPWVGTYVVVEIEKPVAVRLMCGFGMG